MVRNVVSILVLCAAAAGWSRLQAQEKPYFITYDQHMEEPGSLELGFNPVFGHPDGGNEFAAAWLEIEYGIAGWWTAEFYLDGQTTKNESTLFTGWRLENRFRLLEGDRPVNPVVYIEYEDVTGADKTLKEIVGFDSQAGLAEPNGESSQEAERELELKLILGSDFKGWNLSENFVAVKNLTGEPWEFGYAIGANRPIALAASPRDCRFCPENFRVGVEAYGGMGEEGDFTFRGTSQYVAPVVSWQVSDALALKVSPTFGMTNASDNFLLRLGVSYEFSSVGPRIGGGR